MKFDHIAIAVKSIEQSSKIWQDLFGFTEITEGTEITESKVKVSAFEVGNIKIELIEPLSDDSPVARFLEKRGEGLHHICFEVKDIESTLEELKNKGAKVIDETPKKGAFAKKTVFLDPKSTGSVLIEICEM